MRATTDHDRQTDRDSIQAIEGEYKACLTGEHIDLTFVVCDNAHW